MCFRFCNDYEFEVDYGKDLAPEVFEHIEEPCGVEVSIKNATSITVCYHR